MNGLAEAQPPPRSRKGGNSMSKPSTAERRDELHRAIQVKGIRIAIFTLGYWGALLFGANKAAELWPQYFARAPFWAAVGPLVLA